MSFVWPRSMFAANDKMLLDADKSSIMHAIINKIGKSGSHEQNSESEDTEQVMIIDGMAVPHWIELGGPVRSCLDLAEELLKIKIDEPGNLGNWKKFEFLLTDTLHNRSAKLQAIRCKITKDVVLRILQNIWGNF